MNQPVPAGIALPLTLHELHEFTKNRGATCARCGTGSAHAGQACIPRIACTAVRPYTAAYQRWYHPDAVVVRSVDDGDHDDDYSRCPHCRIEFRVEVSR